MEDSSVTPKASRTQVKDRECQLPGSPLVEMIQLGSWAPERKTVGGTAGKVYLAGTPGSLCRTPGDEAGTDGEGRDMVGASKTAG